MISLSFPENCKSGIHEKVFDDIPINDLKANTGLNHHTRFKLPQGLNYHIRFKLPHKV